MARSIISSTALRQISTAHTELYNANGLEVYAVKGGRFEVKCGSTNTVAHSLKEVSAKIDELPLHGFAGSGEEVVADIQKRLGSQYRLEIRAADAKDERILHEVRGSKEHIAESMTGTLPLKVADMVPGKRYALQSNMYGNGYAVLVPLSDVGLPELSPSFEEPVMWEPQPFAKGMMLHGLDPATTEVVSVFVDEAYPNGSFKDRGGKIWSSSDIELFQLSVAEKPNVPDYQEPDDSLYESEDLPTYNPTGEVEEAAPMLNDLANYDSILSASAGILSDFMKTAKGAAYLDRSSLNKISVSGINAEGQATDGSIEWNVRIGSPSYKRSSQILIPMVMKEGSIELGKEFIISTGQRLPLTVEGLKEHLGQLADDPFCQKHASAFPSTIKADADIDALMDGVEKTSSYEEWVTELGDVGERVPLTKAEFESLSDKLGHSPTVKEAWEWKGYEGDPSEASKATNAEVRNRTQPPRVFDVAGEKKTAAEEASAGFSIHTSTSDEIEENARENDVVISDEDWDRIGQEIIKMEDNAVEILRDKYNMRCRTEGHDSNDDLIGTCWPREGHEEEVFETWRENDEQSGVGEYLGLTGNDDDPRIFEGVDKDVAKIVDVDVTFFAVEIPGKTEASKKTAADQTNTPLPSTSVPHADEPKGNAGTGPAPARSMAPDTEPTTTPHKEDLSGDDAKPSDKKSASTKTAAYNDSFSNEAKTPEEMGVPAITVQSEGETVYSPRVKMDGDKLTLEFGHYWGHGSYYFSTLLGQDKFESQGNSGGLNLYGGDSAPDNIINDSEMDKLRNWMMDNEETFEKALSKSEDKSASKKVAGFMQPFVEPGKFVVVDGPYGGETVDADLIGDEEIAAMQKEWDETDEVDLSKYDAAMYFENSKLYDIDVQEGWVAYLSAPGYMDRTENTFFKTQEEAEAFLREEYPDAFNGDDEDEEGVEASIKTAAEKSYVDAADIDELRKLVADEYELEPEYDVVKDPGKFEGEYIASLYYYDVMMNGGGEILYSDEYGGGSATLFDVDAKEQKMFNTDKKYFVMEETSSGFINGEFVDEPPEIDEPEDDDGDDYSLASKKTGAKYEVNVGNIGNIDVADEAEARKVFDEYVEQSKSGSGRAGGESVFILRDGEPVDEYIGSQDMSDDDELTASRKTKAVRKHEVELYEFDELSDDAKAKAIENLRDINVDHDWWDFIEDGFKETMAEKGVEVDEIRFSGFGSQGDGASFVGRVNDPKKFMDVTGLAQKYPLVYENADDMSVDVSQSGHYSHSRTMTTETDFGTMTDYGENPGLDEEVAKFNSEAQEVLRDDAEKLYRDLENQYYGLIEDEVVVDTIKANEYEFEADGTLSKYGSKKQAGDSIEEIDRIAKEIREMTSKTPISKMSDEEFAKLKELQDKRSELMSETYKTKPLTTSKKTADRIQAKLETLKA